MSAPEPTLDPMGTEPWCVGMPRVGTRPLRAQEVARIRRRMKRAERRAWLAPTGSILAAALTVGALLPWGAPWTLVALAWGVELGVAGLILTLMGGGGLRRFLAAAGASYLVLMVVSEGIANVLMGRSLAAPLTEIGNSVAMAMVLVGLWEVAVRGGQQLRLRHQVRLVRQDLDSPQAVDRFEGMPSNPAWDRNVERLLSRVPMDRRRLDVLHRSRLVVRANGQPVRGWILAPVADLAPARPHALRVALPQGLGEDGSHRLRRRSLTPAEREELLRHAGRLRRNVWPLALAVGAAGVHIATEVWRHGSRADLWSATGWFWYVLAALSTAFYLRHRWAARRLETDARLRWVVTVHDEEQRDEAAPRMELLPVSRLMWTEGEQPAPWRGRQL